MKEKTRTLTITEHHETKVFYTFGGFNMEFHGRTESGALAKIKVTLHFCDLDDLAQKLWGMINERKRRIERVESSMRGQS